MILNRVSFISIIILAKFSNWGNYIFWVDQAGWVVVLLVLEYGEDQLIIHTRGVLWEAEMAHTIITITILPEVYWAPAMGQALG